MQSDISSGWNDADALGNSREVEAVTLDKFRDVRNAVFTAGQARNSVHHHDDAFKSDRAVLVVVPHLRDPEHGLTQVSQVEPCPLLDVCAADSVRHQLATHGQSPDDPQLS